MGTQIQEGDCELRIADCELRKVDGVYRKPKTENRKPKPKTENRKPKTENRKPKTENRKPKTAYGQSGLLACCGQGRELLGGGLAKGAAVLGEAVDEANGDHFELG